VLKLYKIHICLFTPSRRLSNTFQEYIIKAHNLKFVNSSRQTTTRDLIRLYNECVLMLIESFKSVHQFL
jgi:hypothetical protein